MTTQAISLIGLPAAKIGAIITMSNNLIIRRVAVLGAGVMGAQIAAHFVNAGIEAVLFELADKDGPNNGLVDRAIKGLAKLKPSPLATPEVSGLITAANYQDHLHLLTDCDLVVEAIAERMDWKKDLYERIVPHLSDHAMLVTNTSGLGIGELAKQLPESLQSRYCGVHFFNPPRYMHLVELIPHAGTDQTLMDGLEAFLTTAVGKGVVRAKDTPNFVGNRIGIFSIASTLHHTREFGLTFDQVDALTGPAIGRPKSATYRTADVVGLDTLSHTISTMRDTLPDDPWHRYFVNPGWLDALIEQGALGQKTGQGVYRKQGKVIEVLDPESGDYRASNMSVSDDIKAILAEKNQVAKFKALHDSDHAEAQFLWAIHRDLFHYCACHLADIAESARELDEAIKWGYGWALGPFELWQAAGWQQVAEWIREDIDAGKAMDATPLPDWAFDGRAAVHGPEGSWSPAENGWSARSDLAVYRRQMQPPRLLGESVSKGHTVEDLPGARLWTLHEDTLIISFKTKMNTISPDVVDALNRAIDLAESSYRGLIIWQPEGAFCAGADLYSAMTTIRAGKIDDFRSAVEGFQTACQRLKYSLVPTVSAVRGLALGGGCELMLQTSRCVAALESYVGLVEAGVGLLPAGGGLKEMAIRAIDANPRGDAFGDLQTYFTQIAMGKVAGSALEARAFGYLTDQDIVVLHEHELLHVAHQQVNALSESGFRPPLRNTNRPAFGDVGAATLKMLLVNMHAGQFISDYDLEISERIATVLSGGAIDRGTPIPESWWLALEREHFVTLAQQEKTLERMAHMLKTGKPLRN